MQLLLLTSWVRTVSKCLDRAWPQIGSFFVRAHSDPSINMAHVALALNFLRLLTPRDEWRQLLAQWKDARAVGGLFQSAFDDLKVVPHQVTTERTLGTACSALRADCCVAVLPRSVDGRAPGSEREADGR